MATFVSGQSFSIYFEERNATSATGYYTNSAFPTTAIEPLSYSYFNDYDLDGNGSLDYSFLSQGLTEEALPTSYVQGMATILRKRSIGNGLANIWLTSVMFYDKKGNVIQVQANNQLSTISFSSQTIARDFSGKTKRTKTIQVTANATTTVYSELSYDHSDRLKTVDEKYNSGNYVRIAGYEYNELGQLVDKKLHSTNSGSTYLQSLDFRYTIRGQLSSINNSSLSADDTNDDTNDVFGMDLLYGSLDAAIGNTAYYNGLISAVKWKVNAPGVVTANQRSYKFSYDKLMRLNSANYADRNGTGAWTNLGAFDEKSISYDLNGNILTL
ncbi:MAG: hypothetical protein EOO89_29300, partial [Pedobacter sp.]